jgi:hypothetical protein
MSEEMPENKIDRINRESAERRARGDFVEDPRVTATDKAREYIGQAEEISKRGLPGDAEWVTAYATLALATLALANTPQL